MNLTFYLFFTPLLLAWISYFFVAAFFSGNPRIKPLPGYLAFFLTHGAVSVFLFLFYGLTPNHLGLSNILLRTIALGLLAGCFLRCLSEMSSYVRILQAARTSWDGESHIELNVQTNTGSRINGLRELMIFLGKSFVVTAAVPAIAEEILDRGIILSILRMRLPTSWAILISGLLFGFGHLTQYKARRCLPFVLYGAAYACLFVMTNSIAPPILAHLVFNFLADLKTGTAALLIEKGKRWPFITYYPAPLFLLRNMEMVFREKPSTSNKVSSPKSLEKRR